MQQKFVFNLILLLFLNLLIKPFWIFIDLSVQNTIGIHAYGLYFAVLNGTFLFNILLDYGITNYTNTQVAKDPLFISRHFSTLLSLRIFFFVGYALFTVLLATLLGYTTSHFHLLTWLVINQFLASLLLFLRANISGLLLLKTDSLLSVLDRFLMILFCSLLLWGGITQQPFKIEWFIWTQTLSYLMTITIATFIIITKQRLSWPQWELKAIRSLLKSSLPYALLIILMTIGYRVDGFMLERILSDNGYQTGIYASAFRLFDMIFNFTNIFGLLLLPIFAHLIKNKESITSLLGLSYKLIILPLLLLVSACLFYATPIIQTLYPLHYMETIAEYTLRIEATSQVFILLMINSLAIATITIFGTLLTANGKLTKLNWIIFSTMVLNIGLNYMLIPTNGALGSAYASLVSQSFLAIAEIVLVYQMIQFQTNKIIIVQFILVGCLSFLLFSLLSTLSWPWYHQAIVGLSSISILIVYFKLLPIKTFWEIIRSNSKIS